MLQHVAEDTWTATFMLEEIPGNQEASWKRHLDWFEYAQEDTCSCL
jgi:hypothetical protein